MCYVSLDFPLSVRSRKGFFFFLSRKGERGCVFAVFGPVPEKEILDSIAHGSIIRVFTVRVEGRNSDKKFQLFWLTKVLRNPPSLRTPFFQKTQFKPPPLTPRVRLPKAFFATLPPRAFVGKVSFLSRIKGLDDCAFRRGSTATTKRNETRAAKHQESSLSQLTNGKDRSIYPPQKPSTHP